MIIFAILNEKSAPKWRGHPKFWGVGGGWKTRTGVEKHIFVTSSTTSDAKFWNLIGVKDFTNFLIIGQIIVIDFTLPWIIGDFKKLSATLSYRKFKENYRYRKKFTYRPPLADEDTFTHWTVSALLCCAFCNVLLVARCGAGKVGYEFA